MPFQKGKSGNPGGLSKDIAQLKRLCITHAPTALQEMLRLMQHGSDDRIKFDAAQEILNRAMGKPTQMVGGDIDSPLRVEFLGKDDAERVVAAITVNES